MSTRLIVTSVATALLLMLTAVIGVQAKVTGKVSGLVADSKSGEALIGATIRVDGTNLITVTDEDGEYFIIGVPVGKYDLSVSHVGYESMTKKEVRILVDLTTPVDFEVPTVAVELPNEVVVYATEPLVHRDLTSSKIIFTQDRLQQLPNILTVQSILTNYPGVIIDRESDLHVRGGRAGQVSYYLDGFAVQDPFTSEAGIRIMPTALEELSLTSGGFTAGYGEALSGVVSAVTPTGGTNYHGKIRSYQGATHPYDVSTGEWGKGSLMANRSLSFDLSGPIPGADGRRYSFYSAGEYLKDEGYLPHDWSTWYTTMTKLSIQPTQKLRLKSNVTYSVGDGAVYEHRDVNGRSYDFNLDGLPLWEKKAYLVGVSGNYVFDETTILTLAVDRFSTRTKSAPEHLLDKHWSEWPGYSEDANGVYNGTIHDENYGNDIDYSDPLQVAGFTVGDDYDPSYRWRESQYNAFSADLVSQINKTNQIKTGFEYRTYDINWDFKQFYNDQPYGENYASSPTYASVFVEDKLEYHDFVVNFGLRFDYRNADIEYNYTPEDTVAHYKKAESKSKFSPRLGVSFPISVTSVVHFNYGLYYQVPRYTYLYTNLDGEVGSGLPLFGNPDLEPEETISYELGIDHMLSSDLRLDLTAYYKDINDLVTTREIGITGANNPMTRFVNADYGSVTGVDLSLELLPAGGNLSGSVSYGFMMAKGNGSNALEPYYTYVTSNSDTLAPVTEYALDFDQRHTVTTVFQYRVKPDWKGSIFGLNLPGAWGITSVGYFGSGLPFTKTDALGNRMGERNESRLPANYSVDMRFNKDFVVNGSNTLTFFVEVDNLFNRKNIVNVYSRTGLPDDDGQVIGAGLSLDAEAVAANDHLFDHDPQNFSPPRTVRTGLAFSF